MIQGSNPGRANINIIICFLSVDPYRITKSILDMEISHIFRNQEVKQIQTKSAVITWSTTIFKFSAQYKLFSLIKYDKIMEYIRNHLEVITKQKIIHCIIDNDLSFHLVKYTNRFILQIGK